MRPTKAKTKPKREPVKPSETWVCALCPEPVVCEDRPGFFVHCRDYHPEVFNGQIIPCKSAMTMHLDGDTWFSTEMKHTLPDGRQLAVSNAVQPRLRRDAMYWDRGDW